MKTPFDGITGEYWVSFTTDETVDDMMLDIKIGGDDNKPVHAEIAIASIDGKNVPIKNGMIAIGPVAKGEKKTLTVKLLEIGRKTLEVRAYAES